MSPTPDVNRMRRAAAGLILGVAALTFGCATFGPRASARHVEAGAVSDTLPPAALYATLCAHCHGPDARGYAADHAPSLVNPTFLESASNGYLETSISRGRPGTSMAAYSKAVGGPLGPAAIEGLVTWLRGSGHPAVALQEAAPGDTTRGRALYETHCVKCHGDAQTRGPYVWLANPEFLAAANDPFLQHAIASGRPGTPMEAYQPKLGTNGVGDVVAFLRSLARPIEAQRLPPPNGREPLFINPKGRPPGDLVIREGRFVPVDEIKRALDDKRKLVIVDARPESDWMTSHIAGAVSIPHYQLQRLGEIPKDAWVVAYCACPHHLSGIVVDSLRARGYPHALVLDEGILEWERRGYPIVAAPGTPLPPKENPAPSGAAR